MRLVLQRVRRAEVRAGGETVGAIGRGLVALVAVVPGDDPATAALAADRLAGLRCFEDPAGKMNLDARAAGAGFLVVSQFTLAADLSRGRRPSFTGAAAPEVARPLVDAVADDLRRRGFEVAAGRFGAAMEVELVNDGPVTFVLDV